jgi:hypothetical protein
MKATLTPQQVVSKERVAAYGEVYTAPREVNAMLDLVKHETERIDARFLGKCGIGDDISRVLNRKTHDAPRPLYMPPCSEPENRKAATTPTKT